MAKTKKRTLYHQYRSGKWEPIDGQVIVEKAVSLTVNGQVWLTLMCTPSDLEALALGFLYNENVIQTMADVASVRVCPTEDNVDAWLSYSMERPATWRRTSGCTGGYTTTSAESSEAIVVVDGFKINAEDVARLIDQLFESQELYKKVGGVHTSALADSSRVLITADDIGRHNTLDKLAGRCLLEGIWPEQRILITTGRISSEMLQKAARIGAPVVISRTSPSSLSVEMAEKFGITLIGYARLGRFTVYSHPERILLPAHIESISEETRVK
jgi:FdhD protein